MDYDTFSRKRHLEDEIIVCGRLPKKADGRTDLYVIERMLREMTDPKDRVAVLKRLIEADK